MTPGQWVSSWNTAANGLLATKAYSPGDGAYAYATVDGPLLDQDTGQGLKPVNLAWCAIYLVCAFYVWRWSRGLLPITAAFAILLLAVALIAGTGLSGTSWFDRSHFGFAPAQSLFGGNALGADTLGFFTVLMAPVQLLLIILAMTGFAQGWNVESEVPEDESEERGSAKSKSPPAPATA